MFPDRLDALAAVARAGASAQTHNRGADHADAHCRAHPRSLPTSAPAGHVGASILGKNRR